MKHGLTDTGTVIDYHTVTSFMESFFPGDFFGCQKEMTDKFLVGFRYTVDFWNVFFRNDKNMNWGLRVNILEGSRERVFIHDL